MPKVHNILRQTRSVNNVLNGVVSWLIIGCRRVRSFGGYSLSTKKARGTLLVARPTRWGPGFAHHSRTSKRIESSRRVCLHTANRRSRADRRIWIYINYIRRLPSASSLTMIWNFPGFSESRKSVKYTLLIYFAYPGIILAIENRAIHIDKDNTKSWYSQEKLIVFLLPTQKHTAPKPPDYHTALASITAYIRTRLSPLKMAQCK